MLKIKFLALIVALSTTFTACKKNVKPASEQKNGYSLTEENTTINWTAFKTTKKVPVKGTFYQVSLENNNPAESKLEALNNVRFKIPVSSVFSNDSIRDGKLKKFFFGVMENTSLISGKVHYKGENKGQVALTMNGVTENLPVVFIENENEVRIKSTLILNNWNAQKSIHALNLVCKELHTGEDGITKTWNEVEIEVIASFSDK